MASQHITRDDFVRLLEQSIEWLGQNPAHHNQASYYDVEMTTGHQTFCILGRVAYLFCEEKHIKFRHTWPARSVTMMLSPVPGFLDACFGEILDALYYLGPKLSWNKIIYNNDNVQTLELAKQALQTLK